MSLIGNRHTEDIDQEILTFSVFSTGLIFKNSKIHKSHKVFFSRFVEIAKKNCRICSKLSTAVSFEWALAKNVVRLCKTKKFNYSFDFDSMMIEKRVQGKFLLCFDKFSKYQKLLVVYLNIYHRDIELIKWYLQGYFTSTGLLFSRSARCLKKKEIGKK